MSDTIESEVIGLSCIEKDMLISYAEKGFLTRRLIFLISTVFIGLMPPTNSVVPAALANPNLGGTYTDISAIIFFHMSNFTPSCQMVHK